MIDILLKFTQKAGRKLKSMRKNVKTMGNKDSSVSSLVTQADVYISDIFAKTVKKHFSHLSYMIIDEEKITNYGKDIFNKIYFFYCLLYILMCCFCKLQRKFSHHQQGLVHLLQKNYFVLRLKALLMFFVTNTQIRPQFFSFALTFSLRFSKNKLCFSR